MKEGAGDKNKQNRKGGTRSIKIRETFEGLGGVRRKREEGGNRKKSGGRRGEKRGRRGEGRERGG